MAMTEAERTGLGAAIAAHLALFALLSLSWSNGPDHSFENPPMAVDLVAEIAPVSTAPEPAVEPPAARRGEADRNVREPEPPPPEPRVAPRPTPPPPTPKRVEPAPTPRPNARAERRPPPTPPRETMPRQRPDRQTSTSRTPPAQTERQPQRQPQRDRRPAGDPLGDIANSVARNSTPNARGPNPPAAQTAAQVQQSITVAVDREIAPFWQRNAPSGIDVDELRLVLEITLNRDGTVQNVRQLGEMSGRTPSNQPQQARFVEQAIRSVRQAAPFDLPAEYYDQWRVVRQPFRARLGN